MRETEVRTSEADPIRPVEISHDVDEIIVDGLLEQHYNFLDYHFEKYDAYCHARTYLDDIETVRMFGPYSDRDSEDEVDAPELYREVLAYLKRRFPIIEALGDDGYVTIWRLSDGNG